MLEPLFDGVDHLILAGDVWQERIAGERITNAGILFAQLKKMIHDRNLSVEILRGNHDPGTPQGVAWCADKAVLVTHGDAVYDEATPWSREFRYYREEIREIIARYQPQTLIGSAGAFEVLASMSNLSLEENPFIELDREKVAALYVQILGSSRTEKLAMLGLPKERVDYISAAFVLIWHVLDSVQPKSILVSKFALKEGVLAQFLD